MATLTADFETITPQSAKKLLDKNTMNRPISTDNLNVLIAEMTRKNFRVTGESIKVAQDGTLLDGQHRLQAIAKSGITVKMLVVRGLETDAFKYIDTGRKRLASDVLAIEGIKNPTKMAAMAKFIVNFKRGKHFASADYKNRRAAFLTNADIAAFVEKNHESMLDSYPYGFNKHNKLVSPATLSALHFILKDINDAQADDFCHKLSVGIGIQNEEPIYVLRQFLLQDIRSTKKSKAIYKLALLCKAWNLYRANKKVKILKWDSIKEPFPKPM
jgi:hypothetical protein